MRRYGSICRNKASGQIQSIIDGTTEPGSPTPALEPSSCSNAVGAFYYHTSGTGTQVAGSGSGSGSGGGATPVFNAPFAVSGSAAAEVSRLTTTVKASQLHILNSFRIDSALALGPTHPGGVRPVMVDSRPSLATRPSNYRRRPQPLGTDAARAHQPARPRTTSSNNWPTPSTPCWAVWTGLFTASAGSSPTPPTNCGHRWPPSGCSLTRRWRIDRPARWSCGRSWNELRSNSEETEHLIEALLLLARSERGIEHWSQVELSDDGGRGGRSFEYRGGGGRCHPRRQSRTCGR